MKIALRTCESSTGDCTLERDLAGGEYHLVIRVIAVPAGDQFFGGLANVLTVEHRTGEYDRDVQPIGKRGVWGEGVRSALRRIFKPMVPYLWQGSTSWGRSWLCNEFPIARRGFWLYA